MNNQPDSKSVRLRKTKLEEHTHKISGATPTERLFVSTNRTLTRYDEKKIGLFNSSRYGIVIRKRKPTHKEKAEAEGWIFLE